MPYTNGNDPKLPVNVKEMNNKDRRQWVHIFNSVMASEKEKGHSMEEGETLAYTEANGVLKKQHEA